ncbi:hypothetical protein CSKR_200868 [Clonorchis sinensis]|uniref:Uncharacterized protein n=1 Tax=Clonorchis sinensis TaxID=79923 RepID=A0A8T1MJT0_CLOSI|nr:hypothetical protein CSKR_200868 [Clonorchis sinensis]
MSASTADNSSVYTTLLHGCDQSFFGPQPKTASVLFTVTNRLIGILYCRTLQIYKLRCFLILERHMTDLANYGRSSMPLSFRPLAYPLFLCQPLATFCTFFSCTT